MRYMCPVCGYPDLDRPPYDDDIGSYDICPSCWFQFGVSDHDEDFTHEQWREKWIKEGMIWDNNVSLSPKGWNPRQQLLNVLPPEKIPK